MLTRRHFLRLLAGAAALACWPAKALARRKAKWTVSTHCADGLIIITYKGRPQTAPWTLPDDFDPKHSTIVCVGGGGGAP